MKPTARIAPIVVLAILLSVPALADDLTGKERFLCTAHLVARCTPHDDCVSGPAYALNIPPFILVDLAAKTLSTPAAAAENRATPIASVERSHGLIVLQGVDGGRAFSWVIVEDSGALTATISDADEGIVGFGACTPHSRD